MLKDVLTDKIIFFDLQFFAEEEKTEEATPKRKSEARKRGQVLVSPELSSAAVLLVFFVFFNSFGLLIVKQISLFIHQIFTQYISSELTIPSVYHLFLRFLLIFAQTVLPFAMTILLAGLAINYMQVGWLFTLEPLRPKFHIFNFANAVKRIFSPQTVATLLKSIAKFIIIIYLVYQVLRQEWLGFLQLSNMEFVVMGGWLWKVIYKIGTRISLMMLVMAFADYAFQRWQYKKGLRMTKQEVKDEYKQAEGDPKVRGKIRSKQMEFAMRRMMQAVPSADVVITNPVHFAVALKYDERKMSAPVVVAKGEGYIALRIREIAEQSGVIIVENPPLAQTLYKTVDIGREVPADLYQAVAEVLAYVYRLKRQVQ